jgi:hypothetical protein
VRDEGKSIVSLHDENDWHPERVGRTASLVLHLKRVHSHAPAQNFFEEASDPDNQGLPNSSLNTGKSIPPSSLSGSCGSHDKREREVIFFGGTTRFSHCFMVSSLVGE